MSSLDVLHKYISKINVGYMILMVTKRIFPSQQQTDATYSLTGRYKTNIFRTPSVWLKLKFICALLL